MIKIAHIADLQVKNRENNLYQSYWENLGNIIWNLKNNLTDVPILVIAGDLFEWCEPNDSERDLIYNFLSNLVKIPHLKEIVLMAGNHDLEKVKKSKKSDAFENSTKSIGHNALNVFVKLIKTLSPEDREKFIYIDESDVYPSKEYPNLYWIGYSLEDDMNIQNIETPEYNNNDIRICVYHAMLKDYVESEKIPIRKDILQTLRSIEEFPHNTIIMAGDIHQNLHYTGTNGQNFYYPGSTQQHTHNEGDYYTISDTFYHRKKAELKGINVYEIIDKDSYSLKRVPLGDYVKYITLELDITKPWNIIQETLTGMVNSMSEQNPSTVIVPGINQTYIKIKTSNVFASKERQIFEILQSSLFAKNFPYNFRISFDYEKVTAQLNTVNSEVVNNIIKEVIAENIQVTEDDQELPTPQNISITPDNIDSLVLSDEQVVKLFNSTADEQIKHVLKTDKTEDLDTQQLKTDILSLFAEQLQEVSGKSKKYSLAFKDISCNQFMALGPNKIDLDHDGITRILGTNGIGKTTLYRMIRWVLTGEVFEGMKASSAAKNNMIVFNKNLPDNDHVIGKMNIENNGTPVTIERAAIRKWKNNVTREQKLSIDWKEYVSTIDRQIKITIKPGTPEEKVVIGDNAETNIALWVGNAINTIMFIDQLKINNLLKSSSTDLNDIILTFIGVDYLKKLEDNLDSVKTLLMNVSKPTTSKEDIRIKLTELKEYLKTSKEKLEELQNANKTQLESDIKEKEIELESVNNKLITIGDIPQKIKNEKESIKSTTDFINNFVKKELKEKKEFTAIKPEINRDEIDQLTEKILYHNNEMFLRGIVIVKADEEKANKTTKIHSQVDQILEEKVQEKDRLNTILSENKIMTSDQFKKVVTFTEESINKIKNALTTEETNRKTIVDDIGNLSIKIRDNKSTIESGICEKCKRPFGTEEEFKALKEKLTKENEEHQIKIDNYSTPLTEYNEKITKFNTAITALNESLIYSKNENLKCFENGIVLKNCEDSKTLIEKHIENIDSNNNKLQEIDKFVGDFRNTIKLYLMYDVLKIGELYAQKYFNELDPHLIYLLKEYFNGLVTKSETTNQILEIKEKINNINEEISEINSKYTKLLKEYNDELEDNTKYNNKVDEDNLEIQNHNKKIEEAQNNLELLNKSLTILEEIKLPEYDKKLAYKNYVIEEINTKRKTLKDTNDNIAELRILINQYNNDILNKEKDYDNYLKYERNQLVWKIYSKVIKNNFKEIIFEYYRTFLNNTLDLLLEDVNFKLFWDSESNLYMIEFENGEVTYTPINQSSGMETIFCGLSLIYTISILNIKNACSHIFIDELSGQLAKGENISYESKNYQELFVKILNKFEDKSIFIIDHNIKDLTETTCYEVCSAEGGSVYVKV